MPSRALTKSGARAERTRKVGWRRWAERRREATWLRRRYIWAEEVCSSTAAASGLLAEEGLEEAPPVEKRSEEEAPEWEGALLPLGTEHERERKREREK